MADREGPRQARVVQLPRAVRGQSRFRGTREPWRPLIPVPRERRALPRRDVSPRAISKTGRGDGADVSRGPRRRRGDPSPRDRKRSVPAPQRRGDRGAGGLRDPGREGPTRPSARGPRAGRERDRLPCRPESRWPRDRPQDGAPGGRVGTSGRQGTARRGLADGATAPPTARRPRWVPRPRVRGRREGGHPGHDARPGLRSAAPLRARRDLRRIPEGRLLRTAALDGSRRDSDDRVDPYLPVAPRGPRGAGPRRAGPPGGHLAAGGARLGPRFDSGNGPQPGHRPGTGPRLSRRRRPNRPHGPIPGTGAEGTAVLGRCGRTVEFDPETVGVPHEGEERSALHERGLGGPNALRQQLAVGALDVLAIESDVI